MGSTSRRGTGETKRGVPERRPHVLIPYPDQLWFHVSHGKGLGSRCESMRCVVLYGLAQFESLNTSCLC